MPIIGKCYTMGVATQVIKNMEGRAKRFFGIDHPRFFPQSVEERAKAFGVGQGHDLSDEEYFILIEALFERVEKLSAEDSAQGFNRKKKVLTAPQPNGFDQTTERRREPDSADENDPTGSGPRCAKPR